jgi:hypothetical protein
MYTSEALDKSKDIKGRVNQAVRPDGRGGKG